MKTRRIYISQMNCSLSCKTSKQVNWQVNEHTHYFCIKYIGWPYSSNNILAYMSCACNGRYTIYLWTFGYNTFVASFMLVFIIFFIQHGPTNR